MVYSNCTVVTWFYSLRLSRHGFITSFQLWCLLRMPELTVLHRFIVDKCECQTTWVENVKLLFPVLSLFSERCTDICIFTRFRFSFYDQAK